MAAISAAQQQQIQDAVNTALAAAAVVPPVPVAHVTTKLPTVPRMYALFFHRLSIYERATDHKYIKGCSHLGKKCGQDQV